MEMSVARFGCLWSLVKVMSLAAAVAGHLLQHVSERKRKALGQEATCARKKYKNTEYENIVQAFYTAAVEGPT